MQIICDLANNHNGDVQRGLAILEAHAPLIREFGDRFSIAVKFQYRDRSILHPTRTSKMTERIASTMLPAGDRMRLLDRARELGFRVGCTPFDEESVGAMRRHGYDFLKIASCSLTDWPLLERAVTLNLPTVASTGGATDEEVERAAQFLARRVPCLTLMHCVSEYPTNTDGLRLDRIDWLNLELPSKADIYDVGFSTHELPGSDFGCIAAVCKGVDALEWHISLPECNAYSLTPDQCARRLRAVAATLDACRVGESSYREQEALLSLRRGAYASRNIAAGERVTLADVTLQMPAGDGQLIANDFGKYVRIETTRPYNAGDPLTWGGCHIAADTRGKVQQWARQVQAVLDASGATLPRPARLVLSHHRGLDNFATVGCGQMVCVDQAEYCKKLIVLLPGQRHPSHLHRIKVETFHVLHGDFRARVDGIDYKLEKGEQLTVAAGKEHSLSSRFGCVVEEVSTKWVPEDSEYTEAVDRERKTEIFLP